MRNELSIFKLKANNYDYKKSSIKFIAFLFLAVSCRKNDALEQKKQEVNASKVSKLPTTEAEKALVKNLEKITTTLKEVYKNPKNTSLVNIALSSKQYQDEAILLRDLIFPASSILKNNVLFNRKSSQIQYGLNEFSSAFWTEVNKGVDNEYKGFLNSLNSSSNARSNNENQQDVSIYFPYSDMLLDPNGGATSYGTVTTLATATADADEGWGSLPVYNNGILQSYTQVLINDEYCIANPTHVVGVVGLENTYPMGVDSVPPPPPPPPGITRLYVGQSVVKKQYDRLISFTGNGGASEMKYCHLTGYLQPVNGQVTSFQDIISVSFSRSRISNRTLVRIYGVWDDDWVAADLEQVLGIYEEDNTNTKTFNGSIGTTVTVVPGTTITGNLGFNVSVSSQDAIIRQLKISRSSYFAGSFQDQGWGRINDDFTFIPLPNINGWPWYDGNKTGGAEVCYTWPYNTF